MAFLERKARVAAGEPLADVMPKCDECDGCGMIVCGVCGGTGKNKEDKFQSDGEEAMVLNSNIYVSQKKGHPCWVCRECRDTLPAAGGQPAGDRDRDRHTCLRRHDRPRDGETDSFIRGPRDHGVWQVRRDRPVHDDGHDIRGLIG